MKSVNLIPAPRRDAKRRRRHHTACVAACGAYAILLACALGVTQLVWRTNGEELDERLAATDNDIHRLERQASDTRSELALARATIEANRIIAEQPDWSVLLSVLAKTTGSDVVLRTITIAPPPPAVPTSATPPTAAAAAAKAAPDFALEITGIGRTPLAVSQHVLRLEHTGLFSKVALVDTGREAFLNENSVAFRLQCTFGDGRAQTAPTVMPVMPMTVPLSTLDPEGINR